jgi:hypothetical protein
VDTAKAASRLRSLAQDVSKRSKTAVLRDVFLDIERAIRAGVSQVVILDELRVLGLDMNEHAFRSALRRLRAERATAPSFPQRGMRTDFSDLPPWPSRFGATTSPGALYDAEALGRLIRAADNRDLLPRVEGGRL